MATSKQTQAARRNVQKAQRSAAGKKTIAHLPSKTRAHVEGAGLLSGPFRGVDSDCSTLW